MFIMSDSLGNIRVAPVRLLFGHAFIVLEPIRPRYSRKIEHQSPAMRLHLRGMVGGSL